MNTFKIRLFGNLEFWNGDVQISSFRSRSSKLLVVALALAQGESVSVQELSVQLWPESEPEQQSQNLRRALADARAALGNPDLIVRTDRALCMAAPFKSDVSEFDRLTRASNSEKAIELYRGPLALGYDDDWIVHERDRREQAFALAVSEYAGRLVAANQKNLAAAVIANALAVAPTREAVYVAAIKTYASMNLVSEALSTFEKLEDMLGDQWGETPSQEAVDAIESLPQGAKLVRREVKPESPSTIGLEGVSGGALPYDAKSYIHREVDGLVAAALQHTDGLIALRGPRQVGKSSLLCQVTRQVNPDMTFVFIDIQRLDREQLKDLPSLYRSLLHLIYGQLHQEPDFKWLDWLGSNTNFEEALGDLLRSVSGSIVLIFDEVDCIFHKDYAADFFGLLRSWYNRRAFERDGEWRRLVLILAHALEPQLFLKDLNQSPFNVGTRLAVAPFGFDEVCDLAACYGLGSAVAEPVLSASNGMPLMARRLMVAISNGLPVEEVEEAAGSLSGPLGDILRRHQIVLSQHPDLAEEFAFVRANGKVKLNESALRLESLGLILISDHGALVNGTALAGLLV